MEHYGWCVGALWVVCESIRERNYRLKKKNYLSGPNSYTGLIIQHQLMTAPPLNTALTPLSRQMQCR